VNDVSPDNVLSSSIQTLTDLSVNLASRMKFHQDPCFYSTRQGILAMSVCKSFLFLFVNLIAVSLHCSNYIGKTSHRFSQLGDPSQRYLRYVMEIFRR